MQKSKTPTILITGATGNIGTELTKQLSAQNVPFRAMVRDTKAATSLTDLESAETVTGDFNDEKTIVEALRGIERAFLLTNSSEQAEAQQSAFVGAARRAGVKHIVKLSNGRLTRIRRCGSYATTRLSSRKLKTRAWLTHSCVRIYLCRACLVFGNLSSGKVNSSVPSAMQK